MTINYSKERIDISKLIDAKKIIEYLYGISKRSNVLDINILGDILFEMSKMCKSNIDKIREYVNECISSTCDEDVLRMLHNVLDNVVYECSP